MKDLLKYIFCNNTIQSYLIVFGVILFTIIIKRKVSKYAAGLLYRTFGDSTKKINRQAFIDLVVQPLELFLILVVLFIAFDKLTFPEVLEFKVFRFTSRQFIETISTSLLIISFIWLCLRSIDFIAFVLNEKANIEHDASEGQIIVFFKDFFKVILVLIGVLMILHFAFNRNIGNLFTGLSIVGAAIALATRESLENLIASFIIFFDKPFTVGDLVKVQQFTGTVEKIGLRSTRIRTDLKTFITVPNKQMVDSVIDNLSLRTQRKSEVKLDVSLKSTVSQLQQYIQEIKNILKTKKQLESYNVHLTDIGKETHVITYDFATDAIISIQEFNDLKEEINLAILQKAEELQIQFTERIN
jgi:MscS family membrane protein